MWRVDGGALLEEWVSRGDARCHLHTRPACCTLTGALTSAASIPNRTETLTVIQRWGTQCAAGQPPHQPAGNQTAFQISLLFLALEVSLKKPWTFRKSTHYTNSRQSVTSVKFPFTSILWKTISLECFIKQFVQRKIHNRHFLLFFPKVTYLNYFH